MFTAGITQEYIDDLLQALHQPVYEFSLNPSPRVQLSFLREPFDVSGNCDLHIYPGARVASLGLASYLPFVLLDEMREMFLHEEFTIEQSPHATQPEEENIIRVVSAQPIRDIEIYRPYLAKRMVETIDAFSKRQEQATINLSLQTSLDDAFDAIGEDIAQTISDMHQLHLGFQTPPDSQHPLWQLMHMNSSWTPPAGLLFHEQREHLEGHFYQLMQSTISWQILYERLERTRRRIAIDVASYEKDSLQQYLECLQDSYSYLHDVLGHLMPLIDEFYSDIEPFFVGLLDTSRIDRATVLEQVNSILDEFPINRTIGAYEL